jgi:transposase-like protein
MKLDAPKVNVMSTVILNSELTCPHCGHSNIETMPTDACQFFYECKSCQTVLRPKAGDCCVYCSYGTVKCPPIQENRSCCNG